MAKYRMTDALHDDFTYWLSQNTRNVAEEEALYQKIMGYLESCTPEDARFSVSHGWEHVRNLVEG